MQIKLSYIDPSDGVTVIERIVNPAGKYSLVTTRDNHRYKDDFSGEMLLKADDYDWVIDAGECTRISVECTFKRVWYGYFSLTDCSIINMSKKFLTVTPLPDDEYSKLEPWMGLKMNIIPRYGGVESRKDIFSVHQYEIEKITVRIDEPYDGDVASNKEWVGYSVNDNIKNVSDYSGYRGNQGRSNSLIHYLNSSIPEVRICPNLTTPAPYITNVFPAAETILVKCNSSDYSVDFTSVVSDQDNQFLWLDYAGYLLKQSGGDLRDYMSYYKAQAGFHTLYEIRNFYDGSGNWDYCELDYVREVYNSPETPPTGVVDINTMGQAIGLGTARGWIYLENDKKWVRRPLSLADMEYPYKTVGDDFMEFINNVSNHTKITGDGTCYSSLIDVTIDGKNAKVQRLYRNRKYEEEDGSNWYRNLYGIKIYQKHMHNPLDIVRKFIKFYKDQGATTSLTTDDVWSQYFENITNPYKGTTNEIRRLFICQNSDVKRPLATEKATKEEFSMNDFLDMICTLTNSAWAIIDGKLRIEHISFFEKGLTYTSYPAGGQSFINPYSIFNIAKNKTFMQLSDVYSYDKPNMPKFEVYEMDGGQENEFDNVLIEYQSGCVNNLPKENTETYQIAATIDYEFTRINGSDSGITIVSIDIGTVDSITVYQFFPGIDKFGAYSFNPVVSLEYLVRNYHDWGRNDRSALLNKKQWDNLQPFKNIIQEIGFLYDIGNQDAMENPYSIVWTGIGYGIIKNAEYNTQTSYMNYELRFSSVREVMDLPSGDVNVYIHQQTTASDSWEIIHGMDTAFLFRPVVFDNSGDEIEYSALKVESPNRITIYFSEAVSGNAHLISMNTDDTQTVVFTGSEQVDVEHNGQRTDDIAISMIIGNDGFEILPGAAEYVSDTPKDKYRFKFSEPASGTVSVCTVAGYVTNVYGEDVSGVDQQDFPRDASATYNKPLVLIAGEEVIYNSHQLITSLRRVGFSDTIIGQIIVMEKTN